MSGDRAPTHDGMQGPRSRRMTIGFVGVVAIVVSLFLITDIVLTLVGLPLVWSALTVAGLPVGLRLESLGIALLPLVGLVWLIGGMWLSGVRFRRGEGTRRWLVPIAVPAVAHAISMAVVNLAA